jgi:hypothetical protein
MDSADGQETSDVVAQEQLDGTNIRVVARVRPVMTRESDDAVICVTFHGDDTLEIRPPPHLCVTAPRERLYFDPLSELSCFTMPYIQPGCFLTGERRRLSRSMPCKTSILTSKAFSTAAA